MVEQSKVTNSSPRVSLANTNSESVSKRITLASDHQDVKYYMHSVEQESSPNHGITMNYGQYCYEKLLSQVSEWLQAEKSRLNSNGCENIRNTDQINTSVNNSSASMLSLERLQRILTDSMMLSSCRDMNSESINVLKRPTVLKAKRHTSARKQQVTLSSSDTEYQESAVPSCDIFLDNTKISHSYERTKSLMTEKTCQTTSSRVVKEEKAWNQFKTSILLLTHTLRLKGWKRVPIERVEDLEVERLSGALTNAVYLISPPRDTLLPKKYPKKILLRIYGPQVEFLINREDELNILQRLARKKIGPRMLGTFSNGRFEEYFNAKTLTADDLRLPDTSKQIAKRMRELHDGIELLDREKEEGPFVWKNWDKWVQRCEEIALFLDARVKNSNLEGENSWKFRGFLCGDEWPKFRLAVDRYRKWLDEYYGKDGIKQKLVFAHNDTQYGNILRLLPDPDKDSSIVPLPGANTHKQLIVIDFEYASANPIGLEFANHFTEWCYNYHSPSFPWLCDTKKYPTLEEQTRFIRSYVNHHSKIETLILQTNETGSISCLNKDNIGQLDLDCERNLNLCAPSINYTQLKPQQEAETELQVQEILKDISLWRAANSAQWIAWGIIQAQIPERDIVDTIDENMREIDAISINSDDKEATESAHEGFDYLSYASNRALFFWGDMLKLGIMTKEELPSQLLNQLKIVDT